MMTQNSQFSKANIHSEQPPTRKITLKVIIYGALALISTALWIHHLFVPSLTGNWLWVCSLFIIGSGGLILWDFYKRGLTTKKTRTPQETASSLDTSQPSFSLLMWLCIILEVALGATLLAMQFNGAANTKEFSASLLAGFSVALFTWLAYRASRYID
jgi:uncharacterized membrane protein